MIKFLENELILLFWISYLTLKPFGSFVTKILTPLSDIDLIL